MRGELGRSITALKRHALLAIAVLAYATASSSVVAHPFTFDTAKMVGFEVLTAEDGAMEATDMVVIKYDGPIAFPMAENLRTIWSEVAKDSRFQSVVLRLNSAGGTQEHGEEIISVLREVREQLTLVTLVGEHDLCASMCIPIFIQGETRFASPASSWMFHGAVRRLSNIPSLSMTMRYVDYFRDRDVGVAFVDSLVERKYLTSPGEYWLSGRELADTSDIVTRLSPSWRPAAPDPGPGTSIRSGV